METSKIIPIAPIMTPDEFAARFAPSGLPADESARRLRSANESFAVATQAEAFAPCAATPTDYFVRNRETGKLELHFDKSTYDELTDAQKAEIRGAFLWGRNSGCWISRCKEPNLWRAVRVAENLGLADAGETGERLSFAEQQERKAERAERRAERFDHRADAAEENARCLQKPITDMHGDIAFFTQPNISSSAGRAFTRRRERMFAAFDRGTEEYRKSEHYRERAEIARRTADRAELKDKGFIQRRIAECESSIRKLRSSIETHENVLLPKAQAGELKHIYTGEPVSPESIEAQINTWLDRLEAELDKLGYYQDAMDALGGVAFSQENIKPGFVVKVKTFGDVKVMSTGPKNFTVATEHGSSLTFSYAEITELVSSEPEAPKTHPFKVGESFTLRNGAVHTIVKVSAKTVTLSTGENTYRVTPKYRPIPASNKWQWVLHVGSGWASALIYRD